MRGRSKARSVAFTAVFAAFSTVFLYLASVFPTGQLGFLGVASLFGVAAVVELGIPGGLAVFAVTAALGLLIVPSKTLAAVYAAFFGYYPVMKALAERLKSRVLEWAVKLAVFNAALTVILFAVKATIVDIDFLNRSVYLMYAVMNAVFVLFDIGVSRVIRFYVGSVYPKIHK